ncbi:MAG TPA: tetratricopeptide repeat protein [Candidatus Omnitrophota bacterium]|nr:tetratricopeptide repeat protein [Candidatus Omnitrophota bacterium]
MKYDSKSSRINLVFILSLVLLAHINIFHNGFVLDDFDYTFDWPLIQDWGNLPKFFIGYEPLPSQPGIYSPFKTLFHAINYHLFKDNVWGYHVVSLLIHAVGVWLVYQICFLLAGSHILAFLSSLFFALHPVQVEAITYITASVDMIGIVYLFAAFFCYIKSKDDNIYYWGALIAAFLAIFTHELAISLPLLLLWYDLTLREYQRGLKEVFTRLWPFFVIAVFYAVCKYFVLGSITRGGYVYDSFYLTMLISVKAMAKYVWICFFPFVLTFNHVISKGIYSFGVDDFALSTVLGQSIFDVPVLVSLAVLGIIFYFAYKKYKETPLITFCIGWFFISLLPGMNIIPSGVYFAERYLYPGLWTFCLIVALYLEKFYHSERTWLGVTSKCLTATLTVIVVVFYIGKTLDRNRDWHDDVVLYESAVRANPESALMRTDMGIVYLDFQQYDKAIDSLEKALSIRPDDPDIHFALSKVYEETKQYDKAIESLETAIKYDPDFAAAYYNQAVLYMVIQNIPEALRALNISMDLYRKRGEVEEAVQIRKVFRDYFGY